jgi:hypothetical protein
MRRNVSRCCRATCLTPRYQWALVFGWRKSQVQAEPAWSTIRPNTATTRPHSTLDIRFRLRTRRRSPPRLLSPTSASPASHDRRRSRRRAAVRARTCARSPFHSRLVWRQLPRASASIGVRSSRLPLLVRYFAACAPVFSAPGFAGRVAAVRQNARPRPKSSLRTAIGIKHSQIVQTTGLRGGSLNAREFLHGRSTVFLDAIRCNHRWGRS